MNRMDEFTHCSICFEPFDDINRIPKLLPCQHSFCAKCMNDLVRGPASIDCPICRVNHRIKIEDVPKNRFIIQFLETNRNIPRQSQPTAFQTQPREYPVQNKAEYPIINNPALPLQYGINNPGAPYSNIEVPINQYNESPNQNNQPNYNSNQSFGQNKQQWDDKRYLRSLFDEIDHNHDSEISARELHEALRKGQPINQFDFNTVMVLLKKYDRNNDNEISFEEFYQLFNDLNQQYNEFLDIDMDFSGSIDSKELAASLHKKGFVCTQNFYNYLLGEMIKKNIIPQEKVTFDIYVRMIARFENLRSEFKNLTHNLNKPINNLELEKYLAQRFLN